MHPRFPMVDQTVLAFVHELDRVFDGDYMVAPVLVTIIHHRRQRSGFAGAGWARYHDQAAVEHGELLEHRWKRRVKLLEILKREHFAGNLAKHSRNAVLLVEEVGAET